MTLAAFSGGFNARIGPSQLLSPGAALANPATLDAANEAVIYVGRIKTSDGSSHTIDTSGSSSIAWRTGSVTFANAGTTVKVGIAPVDAGNGPPPRASNAADVISFDVSADFTGGGGGITTGAWQTSVPTTGTKTIANGDLVAVCIQMTARGGADTIANSAITALTSLGHCSVTAFTGGSYAIGATLPNVFITFADGATGYLYGSFVASTQTSTAFNTGSTPDELGQLYQFPFPWRIYGAYGIANLAASADLDVVLYSDPLGTPVAEETASIDVNTFIATGAVRQFEKLFATPYDVAANAPVAIVYKPTTANSATVYRKLMANAAHRLADPWGTTGYGVSRTDGSGAFANINSSLDHIMIGLMAAAFDDATGSGGGGISRARGANGGM